MKRSEWEHGINGICTRSYLTEDTRYKSISVSKGTIFIVCPEGRIREGSLAPFTVNTKSEYFYQGECKCLCDSTILHCTKLCWLSCFPGPTFLCRHRCLLVLNLHDNRLLSSAGENVIIVE